jgi:hypothetical protein
LDITSRITDITSLHVLQNLRHFVLCPTALSALADHEHGWVNGALLQPAQKRTLAHGQ